MLCNIYNIDYGSLYKIHMCYIIRIYDLLVRIKYITVFI
jgi:hypothetical protein